jgi:hypothetical protein
VQSADAGYEKYEKNDHTVLEPLGFLLPAEFVSQNHKKVVMVIGVKKAVDAFF